MSNRTPHRVLRHHMGIALVAVLWSVVLLSLIASMVITLQRTQSHVARRLIDGAVAEAAADSALNLTLLRIGSRDPSAMGTLGAAGLRTPEFAKSVSVSIQRERERVDLNAADSGTLTACFLNAGFSSSTATSMASRVIDWRDVDDVPGPGGAEVADYHAAGLRYGPRNGPFQSVEELRAVLGMDTLRSSVLRRFTVYTHESDQSPGGANASAVASNPSSRRCGGSAGGSASGGPDGLVGEVVRIRACSSGQAHLCRMVVARLTGSLQKPFQIFVWRTVAEDED